MISTFGTSFNSANNNSIHWDSTEIGNSSATCANSNPSITNSNPNSITNSNPNSNPNSITNSNPNSVGIVSLAPARLHDALGTDHQPRQPGLPPAQTIHRVLPTELIQRRAAAVAGEGP